jgi:activator of HSP90 ATPase
VPADPLQAFEVFTQEIALWWRPSGLFRVGSTGAGDGRLAFEPDRGRLITTFEDGTVFEIGRISVWEPGRRLAFTWRQSNFTAEQSTEVEVCFERAGAETRISIEHRAWDTIPRRNAPRHGFPEQATLQRAADWWRNSLHSFKDRLTGGGDDDAG